MAQANYDVNTVTVFMVKRTVSVDNQGNPLETPIVQSFGPYMQIDTASAVQQALSLRDQSVL